MCHSSSPMGGVKTIRQNKSQTRPVWDCDGLPRNSQTPLPPAVLWPLVVSGNKTPWPPASRVDLLQEQMFPQALDRLLFGRAEVGSKVGKTVHGTGMFAK